MWAHYGDRHRGVCLGFDVDDAHCRPVGYIPDRLADVLNEKPRLGDLNFEKLLLIMTTKSSEWSYEKEQRLIIPFGHAEQDADGLHFLPFATYGVVLRELILGYRCKWQLAEAALAVQDVVKEVRLKRARPSFNRFEMVRQRKEPVVRIKLGGEQSRSS
jgi:hypothetical protein